jgi:ankyrin repeat protein
MKKETIINIIKEDDTLHLMNDLKNNSKEELNELSNDEETFPLLFAIKNREYRHFIFSPEVLKKLDLNMTNKHGTTALIELAKRGMANEMAILVKAGADWTLKDEKGKTAHEYAYEYAHDFDVDTVQEGCEHTLEAFHILEELRDTKSKTELALSNGTNTDEYLD